MVRLRGIETVLGELALLGTCGHGGCGRATTRHVPQPVKGPEHSAPTQGQIEEIHDYLGSEATKEFNRAQVEANNGERALPVIAGVAISAVAWCASGALSSIPTSILVDLVNRGEGGGDYVKNAIFGCAGGTIGKGAWNLVPKSVKQKIMNATVKFYLEHIRKK